MATDEQEYNNFMADISEKAIYLQNKYSNLSEDNKRKFLLYIEPIVRAGGTQGFMNQMNILFNAEKKIMSITKINFEGLKSYIP